MSTKRHNNVFVIGCATLVIHAKYVDAADAFRVDRVIAVSKVVDPVFLLDGNDFQ